MEFKLYALILYVQHKQSMCTLFLSLGTYPLLLGPLLRVKNIWHYSIMKINSEF